MSEKSLFSFFIFQGSYVGTDFAEELKVLPKCFWCTGPLLTLHENRCRHYKFSSSFLRTDIYIHVLRSADGRYKTPLDVSKVTLFTQRSLYLSCKRFRINDLRNILRRKYY